MVRGSERLKTPGMLWNKVTQLDTLVTRPLPRWWLELLVMIGERGTEGFDVSRAAGRGRTVGGVREELKAGVAGW
jgi:hypothetical protein